jgi:hypothetical protein
MLSASVDSWSRGLRGLSCLVIVTMCLNTQSAKSQTPVRVIDISEAPSCTSCRIHATRSLVLNGGAGVRGDPLTAVRDKQGRFILGIAAVPFQPLVFGPRGNLRSPMGAESDTDRFLTVTTVFSCRSGLVCIQDARAQRIYTYDGALHFDRWINLRAPWTRELVQTGRGDFVAAGDFPSPNMVGLPLHLFAGDGSWIRSFGGDSNAVYVDSAAEGLRRVIAPNHTGGFWAAHVSSWELEKWDSTAALQVRIIRRPPWFTPYGSRMIPTRDIAPRPKITAVREDDSQQFVWVTTLRAAPDWRDSSQFEMRVLADSSRMDLPMRPEKLYETVIEAIDQRTGQILARRVIPAFVTRLLDGGYALALRSKGENEWEVDIWRLSLTR